MARRPLWFRESSRTSQPHNTQHVHHHSVVACEAQGERPPPSCARHQLGASKQPNNHQLHHSRSMWPLLWPLPVDEGNTVHAMHTAAAVAAGCYLYKRSRHQPNTLQALCCSVCFYFSFVTYAYVYVYARMSCRLCSCVTVAANQKGWLNPVGGRAGRPSSIAARSTCVRTAAHSTMCSIL